MTIRQTRARVARDPHSSDARQTVTALNAQKAYAGHGPCDTQSTDALPFPLVLRRPVKDVKVGTVVRFKGEWGVLEKRLVLDRWYGGRIRLRPYEMVEILESEREKGAARD